jgi:uncharacterized protein YkwD
VRTATIAGAAAAVLALPASGLGTGGIPLGPCDRAPASDPVSGRALTGLVNATRAGAGLSSLRTTASLSRIARTHTLRMASRRRLAHSATPGGRFPWSPRGRHAGENLVMAESPEAALRAMLGSGPHRQLLLSGRWRTIGVGAVSTCGGVLYTLNVMR